MNEYTEIPGGLTAVPGFLAAGIHAGLKKAKKDMALICSTVPAVAAGVFTTNKVKAAPLLLNMEHLQNDITKAIVINSGNANACTGAQGMKDAQAMAELTAEALGLNSQEVLVASTGVIGVQMPMDKVAAGIKLAAQELSPAGGPLAAEAIMTTDTFLKQISFQFTVGGKTVTLGGAAKGSGMIHPNMATMLGFITTDLAIGKEVLQHALSEVVKRTFNMITVDGDTSTNDMVLVLANGLAGNQAIKDREDDGYDDFYRALTYACTYLAKEIARDGEGATKLLTVEVLNAPTELDAQLAAKSVCGSNLVKTALFGEDANWGRILAAVGYSGADFDPAKVDIFIKSAAGEEQVAAKGTGLNFSEEKAKKILEEKEVTFIVDLNSGKEKATAWSCDFSYDYVKINASYRT
ncbi:bifunctional ornithine acetyltransferase/N-acetylglutamate synthase [Zhaonella formicivorans]|uniref:bifunctional ornithine acetyltransferase/N-acetylglutamate synthase n=1 Tax=Zhaonella formicivorans TaxID=2528593 RepID=UPI001D118989|nr:bifunctional ornithine acetyltransferase/N-acetylglutamate synthase [Zhaonella formicivorans]